MERDDAKETAEAREDLARIKDAFAAEMSGLRRRQRSAVEKALKAVDKKKIEKIKRSLDDLAS